MLALEEEPTTRFLRALSTRLPRPDAIIVASAHWETAAPSVTGAGHPQTIHDFSGFPEALYQLRYPAPGSAKLAARVGELLSKAGFTPAIDPSRGFDHGVWEPLLVMYPDATIPVLELSIQPAQDARWHYRIGEALAPLRKENILIIGSGNLTHNLREAFRGQHAATPAWVGEFANWIAAKIEAGDIVSLLDWQHLAPHARQNHPTPEHFLPFFVALGAAGGASKAERLNQEVAMGVLAMDVYAFHNS